jgi:hypothetical protein
MPEASLAWTPRKEAPDALKDHFASFKALRSSADKVKWLEAMREMLSTFDIKIDGLIEAWKKRGDT